MGKGMSISIFSLEKSIRRKVCKQARDSKHSVIGFTIVSQKARNTEMDFHALPDTAAEQVLLQMREKDLRSFLNSDTQHAILSHPYLIRQLSAEHMLPLCDTKEELEKCLNASSHSLLLFAARKGDDDYLLSNISTYTDCSVIPRLVIKKREDLILRFYQKEKDYDLYLKYYQGTVGETKLNSWSLNDMLMALLGRKEINLQPFHSILSGANCTLLVCVAAVTGNDEFLQKILEINKKDKGTYPLVICRWALKAKQMKTFLHFLPCCKSGLELLATYAASYGRVEAIPIITKHFLKLVQESMYEKANPEVKEYLDEVWTPLYLP